MTGGKVFYQIKSSLEINVAEESEWPNVYIVAVSPFQRVIYMFHLFTGIFLTLSRSVLILIC